MLIGNDTQMSPSFVGQNVCRNDASIARNAKCTFFMTNAREMEDDAKPQTWLSLLLEIFLPHTYCERSEKYSSKTWRVTYKLSVYPILYAHMSEHFRMICSYEWTCSFILHADQFSFTLDFTNFYNMSFFP